MSSVLYRVLSFECHHYTTQHVFQKPSRPVWSFGRENTVGLQWSDWSVTAGHPLHHELGRQHEQRHHNSIVHGRASGCHHAGHGLVGTPDVSRACRFRGEESGYAPWLALLPHAFTTPLFYTPDELDQLRGTTLYQATLCARTPQACRWHLALRCLLLSCCWSLATSVI